MELPRIAQSSPPDIYSTFFDHGLKVFTKNTKQAERLLDMTEIQYGKLPETYPSKQDFESKYLISSGSIQKGQTESYIVSRKSYEDAGAMVSAEVVVAVEEKEKQTSLNLRDGPGQRE